jgi:hypothetical protein
VRGIHDVLNNSADNCDAGENIICVTILEVGEKGVGSIAVIVLFAFSIVF